MMGYRTPNIDRIAKEGAIFTDYYGQQSCTAGRAAFLTGQSASVPVCSRSACPGPKRGCPRRPHAGRTAQATRVWLRPVRQEPPGRPQRAPADRPRLRQFSATSTTSTPRRNRRNPNYPKNPDFKKRFGPPAYSSARRPTRPTQPSIHVSERSASRQSGHRPAHQKADGDGGRGVPGSRCGLHRHASIRRASPFSAGGTRPECTFTRT